jgi:hypothetical protein
VNHRAQTALAYAARRQSAAVTGTLYTFRKAEVAQVSEPAVSPTSSRQDL